MAPLLIEQLDQLGKRVRPETWEQERDWGALALEAEKLTAIATDLFREIELAAAKKQPPDPKDWDEAVAREFVPAFKSWYEYASQVKALRRECKAHGYPIAHAVELAHACNMSRILGADFDDILESFRRFERGESRGRPLEEVVDELRRRSGVSSG